MGDLLLLLRVTSSIIFIVQCNGSLHRFVGRDDDLQEKVL